MTCSFVPDQEVQSDRVVLRTLDLQPVYLYGGESHEVNHVCMKFTQAVSAYSVDCATVAHGE